MSSAFKLVVFAMAVASAIGCADGVKQEPAARVKPVNAAASIAPQARAADPVYAYVDDVRDDLSDGKAKVFSDVMRLTSEESAKFWPIYRDYEEELFAPGDQRVEITRKLVTAQAARTLDDPAAASLTDQWFDLETKRLELMRKYQQQIASELSPLRAAQFTQIENRVGTVIDLMIASEIPLVRTPPSNP